jgi:hypothetical protein
MNAMSVLHYGNCSSAVESRIVIPVVVGSNPISYPNTPVDELAESLLSKGRRKNLVVGSNPTRGTIKLINRQPTLYAM